MLSSHEWLIQSRYFKLARIIYIYTPEKSPFSGLKYSTINKSTLSNLPIFLILQKVRIEEYLTYNDELKSKSI